MPNNSKALIWEGNRIQTSGSLMQHYSKQLNRPGKLKMMIEMTHQSILPLPSGRDSYCKSQATHYQRGVITEKSLSTAVSPNNQSVFASTMLPPPTVKNINLRSKLSKNADQANKESITDEQSLYVNSIMNSQPNETQRDTMGDAID